MESVIRTLIVLFPLYSIVDQENNKLIKIYVLSKILNHIVLVSAKKKTVRFTFSCTCSYLTDGQFSTSQKSTCTRTGTLQNT